MLSLTNFASEMERERAKQRTYDANGAQGTVRLRHRQQDVRLRQREVLSPDGRRDHVARQINADEAAVIRRIYELCAAWLGLTRIAKKPNAERVQPPRNHRTGWAPTAILEILRRPLYRGEIVWGKGQKAMRGGAKALRHPY